MSAYADYDYLVVRAYVPNEGSNVVTKFSLNLGAGAHQLTVSEYNQWVDYKFKIDTFVTDWENRDGLYCLAPNWEGEGCLYIADIHVEKDANKPVYDDVTETVDADEVLDFDEAHDLEQMAVSRRYDQVTGFEWLESYEGETGVVKISYHDDGPAFTFNAAQAMSAYENYDYLVVKMYVPSTNKHLNFSINQQDLFFKVADGTLVQDAWAEYKFPMYLFKNNWNADGTPNKGFITFWGELVYGEIYISDIYVASDEVTTSVEETETTDVGEGLDVNQAEAINMLSIESEIKTVECLESYEGETGVTKITYNSGNLFTFTPAQEMSPYADMII